MRLTLCKSTLRLNTFIKVDVHVFLLPNGLLFWIFYFHWNNSINFEIILECSFIPLSASSIIQVWSNSSEWSNTELQMTKGKQNIFLNLGSWVQHSTTSNKPITCLLDTTVTEESTSPNHRLPMQSPFVQS